MKLLIIIDDLVNGGTENVLASRLSRLPSKHQVQLVTLYAMGPVADVLIKNGVPVDFINMAKIGYRQSIKVVQNKIKQEKFDLAICMRDVSRGLFPWSLRNELPVVMFWDNPQVKRSFRQSWAEWFQVKFANPFMYCCSDITRKALVKNYGVKDIEVIPNCFDDKKFYPVNKIESGNPFKIISVGNIREEKKHADKILIAAKLKDKGFDFKMEIIGHGDVNELKALISDHGLAEQVILPGEKDDIHVHLRSSQIFLLTSQVEGFPVSLLEAMATGLPCITYEFPGLEEIDPYFSHCEVVPQGDINAAVEKIIYFSKHQEKGKELGKKAAVHVVKFFSAKENTRQWEKYLQSLIKY